MQLPFGLVMKWTDRTSIEEAVAMQIAAAAGIPVPKFLSCGEHPDDPFNRTFSILMTRLPGVPLRNSFDHLEVDKEPWLHELKTFTIYAPMVFPLSGLHLLANWHAYTKHTGSWPFNGSFYK